MEAELIGFDGIPALQESLEELRDCGESFLGLHDETGLAGAVSWVRLPDGTVDICRLMVHPRAHRRGIATVLLDSLDRAEPAQRAVVSTGTANHPALALYKRRGFIAVGTRMVAPATSITILERQHSIRGSARARVLTTLYRRGFPGSASAESTGPASATWLDAVGLARNFPRADGCA